MAQAVEITRTEYGAAGLRLEAKKAKSVSASRRMLALANVLEGKSRAEAALLAGMERQALRDAVLRYNAQGLAGLYDLPHPGRPPKLTPEQRNELKAIVLKGPDPKVDKIVRWRCCDLQKLMEKRFGYTCSERHMGRILASMGLVHISARPQHPKSEPETQEAFKKTSWRT